MSWCDNHENARDSEPIFDAELLLLRAKGGDGAALGRLLERYRNYVGLLVRLQVGRRLRTKVDIEDLLQEIWLEIHRKIGSLPGRIRARVLELGSAANRLDPGQPGATLHRDKKPRPAAGACAGR